MSTSGAEVESTRFSSRMQLSDLPDVLIDGVLERHVSATGLAALPVSGLVHGFEHTLEGRSHWESTKPSMTYCLMGAVAYTTTPVTLASDALNLGTWHGFQEVLTREAVSPKALSFSRRVSRIRSNPQSYFPLYFSISLGKACMGQWAVV